MATLVATGLITALGLAAIGVAIWSLQSSPWMALVVGTMISLAVLYVVEMIFRHAEKQQHRR